MFTIHVINYHGIALNQGKSEVLIIKKPIIYEKANHYQKFDPTQVEDRRHFPVLPNDGHPSRNTCCWRIRH